MSDAAPAAAPVAAPTAAPNAAPDTVAPAAPENAAAVREKRRVLLSELADDDEFVSLIDGKETVQTAAEWRREYQRGISATRRYQAAAAEREQARREVAEARQQAEELMGYLRDPRALFAAIVEQGGNLDNYYAMIQQAAEAERGLSPEARELRRIKAQQAAYERQQQQAAQQQQQQLQTTYERQYRQIYDKALAAAGVPEVPEVREVVDHALTKAFAKRMAEQDQDRKQGRRPRPGLSDADLVAIAAQVHKAQREAIVRTLDAETAKQVAAKHTAPSPVSPTAAQPRDEAGRFQPKPNQPRPRTAFEALQLSRGQSIR